MLVLKAEALDSALDVMGTSVTLCAASADTTRSVKAGLHAGSWSTATGSADALAMPNVTTKEARVNLILVGLGAQGSAQYRRDTG